MNKKLFALALAAVMLSGCGDTSKVDKLIEQNSENDVTLSPTDEAVAAEAEKAVADQQDNLDYLKQDYTLDSNASQPPLQLEPPDENTLVNGDIDIDLTGLDANMLYAQIYAMTSEPEKYVGKKVRVKGTFNYMKDNGTEYFAVFIAEAAACCQQGLEFRRSGEFTYPDDYPAIDAPITVTGIFNTYQEGLYTYCEIKDADLETM
jgi:outer membrane murein-binding lipoprotein Lpp